MVHISNTEVLTELRRIEQLVVGKLAALESRQAAGTELMQLLDDGLKSYRERILKSHVHLNPVLTSWLASLKDDRALGFPHRKILESLLSEYDFATQEFRRVHFSLLVRRARVGKSRAKAYLALLEQRGYVERFSDGYRILFRVRR